MARISEKDAGGPNVLAFLDMLATSEGTADQGDDGYNVLVGSSKAHPNLFQDYSQHPHKLVGLKDKNGIVKLHSTAAGRYQILWFIWDTLRRRYGFKDFMPVTQDMACIWLLRDAHAFPDIVAGDFASAVYKCRKVWASLPGAGYDQHENQLATLEAAYKAAGGIVVV